MKTDQDLAFMEMAFGLAERARGRSSPNPLVGSVVVNRGTIVGHGYHREAGTPHAEILALQEAGPRSAGGTIYITMEPCVHWGRTPPCVDALIRSGLRKAVISAYDPNPLVHRKGVERLRRSRMNVVVGLLEERNAAMNEAYVKYITQKVPFVTLKAALSLDGKIACRSRDSKWISSDSTRNYVHLLRGEHDALLVGVNTLVADNPRLTVRHPNWGGKKVTRVILDSGLRTPLQSRILSTLSRGEILIFARRGASPSKAEALTKKGAEIAFLGGRGKNLGLGSVLAELGRREIASVLVEGGSQILTSFIEKKLADKIVLTLSPKLIGGREAPGFLEGEGVDRVGRALPVRKTRAFRLDEDLILEGYF